MHKLEEERVVPWGDPGLFASHRARYEFSLPLAAGRRVLDVGSGEGFGAALLAQHAREVVGVDYSPAAIEHATKAYPRPNLSFRVTDATALPPDLSDFDVVTCFEVIEHIADGDALVRNLRRALRPGGVLVLSTPNRLVERPFERVSDRDSYEYHVNVFAPSELRRLIRSHFSRVVLYGQSIRVGAVHSALKTFDVFNLRHYLVRSKRVQRGVTQALGKPPLGGELEFRFSRLLIRQSAILVVVANV